MRIAAKLAALLVGLLAIAPVASATMATLRIATAAPVTLSGEVAVTGTGGAFFAVDPEHTGSSRLVGATGILTIWTWTDVEPSDLGITQQLGVPVGNATWENYTLGGGAIELSFARENLSLTLVPEGAGARITIGGAAPSEGRPVAFPRDFDRYAGNASVPYPTRTADAIGFRWERGWPFVADGFGVPGEEGLPAFDAPIVNASGEMAIQVNGGVMTFTDVGGASHQIHLGLHAAQGDPLPSSSPAFARGERQRAIFHGTLASADVRPATWWGYASPDLAWRLHGSATWTDAEGTYAGGGTRTFERATVVARGDFDARAVAAVGGVGRDAYDAAGEFASITIDGAIVGPAPVAPVGAAATGLAALLLALAALFPSVRAGAGRFLAVGYTRLARSELMDHPVRKAIYEIVRADGTLHMRELHRRLGRSWGVFAFHLQMLTQAGLVRTERSGSYVVVRATDTDPVGVTIPHPITRRVYEAIPPEGIAVQDLEARTGVSRQLLAYHVRVLTARGIVARMKDENSRAMVKREKPRTMKD